MDDMRKLGSLDIGVPEKLTLKGKCGVCQLGKHKRVSFGTPAKDRASEVLGLVHSDLMTVEQLSLGGAKYVVVFTDDFSRYRCVYFMAHKSETLNKFRDYVSDMRAVTGGRTVKAFRSDNGGEYTGHDFKAFCKESGIRQTFSGPHAPQQNGVAERSIGIIEGATRCHLIQSGLRKGFWAEAMSSAIYAINRSPSAALDGDIPYHLFFGKHAKLGHLRPFGCRAFVHVYDEDRKKMDPKAVVGIQVGYHPSNNRCYRVYVPESGSFKYTVHVTHDELSFPFKPDAIVSGAETHSISEGAATGASDSVGGDGDRHHQEHQGEEMKEEHQQHDEDTGWRGTDEIRRQAANFGRGRRETRSTMCQDDECRVRGPHMAHYSIEYACVASGATGDEPKSYAEAIKSPESQLWKEAMDAEYKALVDNGTWELCELPPGRKAIGNTWVFKIKYDESGNPARYKARFVSQGFSQMPGIDFFETTSPVVKMVCVRTVLALANQQGWILENMDFDTAFLQSPVEEEIYVRQPKGYEIDGTDGRTLVCRLKKSLYGLKQASRNWNQEIDAWLQSFGLKPSGVDPCVYVMVSDSGGILVVLIYVDDLVITGNSRELIDEFKSAISESFKVKDLGALRWILGMEVRRDEENKTIELLQTAYIDRVLERFGMKDCKPVGTPAEGLLSRVEGGVEPDPIYMGIVGCLIWLCVVVRPDIAYAVQALGRHMQRSGHEHMVAAKRVLRFLQGTRSDGVKFHADVNIKPELTGFSDSDWGSDKDTRRSTTGYVFMLCGGSISWTSKLQPTVALSSTEAEYMAACAAAQEAIFLRCLLADLGFPQSGPTTIFEDNQGCIYMSENSGTQRRGRHIDIRHHFVRERVANDEIKLTYIRTDDQLADLLTKPLLRQRLDMLRKKVLGY
jgi:hypothetical protein